MDMMSAVKEIDHNQCSQSCGEVGAFIHSWWTVKRCSHFGKQSGIYSAIKHRVNIWTSSFTSRYTVKRNDNICPHKNLSEVFTAALFIIARNNSSGVHMLVDG